MMWLWTGAYLFASIMLVRWRSWLPLVVWPIGMLLAFGTVDLLYDARVGPSIREEAGWGFVVQAHVEVAVDLLGAPIIMAASTFRRRRRQA